MNNCVSVVIPIFNEIKYLERCLESIIKGSKKFNDFEILLIDGGSTDGTIELISELTNKYDNITYLNNPNKYTPSAMNIGIKNSSGDYIVRLDAHAVYPPLYIEKLIRILNESDDDVANVGGSIITKPLHENLVAISISFVLSSKFGVGNSSFRTGIPKKTIEVDTVPFGCFKKNALIKVGMYNELEIRGEDLDLNTRLIKAGYKIILSPEITSIYYSRDNYLSFIKQAFKNGYTVFAEFRGNNSYHKIRHYIPLAFIIFQIFFFLSLGVKDFYIVAKFLLLIEILYILLCLFFSINLVLKEKFFLYFLVNPIIFLSLHSIYGLGSLFAIIKNSLSILRKFSSS